MNPGLACGQSLFLVVDLLRDGLYQALSCEILGRTRCQFQKEEAVRPRNKGSFCEDWGVGMGMGL